MLNGPKEAPRILIVEDDRVSAMLLRKHFESMELHVDHAEDGEAALEMHKKRAYHLVVSDWMMPKMDGIELCQAFRAFRGPYVYFILCTARSQKEERMVAFEAGVDDFISKPLDRDELRCRLKVAKRILNSEEILQIKQHELASSADRLESLNINLNAASKRFEELFSGLPVSCFTMDSEGTVHEWNREAQRVFGIAAHEAILRPVWDVLENSSGNLWTADQADSLFSEEAQTEANVEWTFTHSSGEKKVLVSRIIRLRNSGRVTTGAICATTDITERYLAAQRIKEMNAQLSELAVTDGLTGLSNRRRFQEMLESASQDHARNNEPLSLIILDIDHFKRVNDDFGHQAGDEILIQFAKLLKDFARQHELPARYGGEEFALILGRCDGETAEKVAERFRSAIQAHIWPFRPITASLGVTTMQGRNTIAAELISRADRALYASKEAGRNRVTSFEKMTHDLPNKAA